MRGECMSVRHDDVGAIGVRPTAIALSPGVILALTVLVYLVLHIALRLWETPVIAKNDVQEAIAAQAWAWGYHPRNPPLHTWLLMGSYTLFGHGLVAHVVLKYTLLGGVFAFAYLCARRLLSTPMIAGVAALSMSMLGPLAWTVHTALTHTLLLAVMILATLWAAMRVTDRRRTVDYLLFGAAIGLGLLAKYSFLLFLAPLMAAMLTQRDLRSALIDARMFAALAIAMAILAPHALWMLGARFDFVAFLSEKQHGEVAAPYLSGALSGLSAVLAGALTFLAPFVLIIPAVFWRQLRSPSSASSSWGRTLVLICAFGLALLVVDVFVLRATEFELRYFTAALLVAPLAAFQWIDRRAPSTAQLRAVCAAAAIVALIGFAGLTGRALFANRTCDRCWEEMPVERLVHDLHVAGFAGGTIIADHYNLAGNMRLAYPTSRTIAANYDIVLPPFSGQGSCALVWNARNAGEDVPPAIVAYLQETGLAPVHDAPRYVEAPLYRSADRVDRFGFIMVSGVDGNCRPS